MISATAKSQERFEQHCNRIATFTALTLALVLISVQFGHFNHVADFLDCPEERNRGDVVEPPVLVFESC